MGWMSNITGNLGTIGTALGGVVGAMYGNPQAGMAIGGGIGKMGEGYLDKPGGGGAGGLPGPGQTPYKYDLNAYKLGNSGTGQFNLGQSNEIRGRQLTLADQLAMQAQGQGPSIADQQAAMARQSLFSQGLSSVASQRGGNPAMAQRNFMNALAQGNQGIQANAGIQRLQEQQLARQQLSDVLGNARGADLTGAQGDLAARIAQLNANKELQAAQAADLLERDKIRAGLIGGEYGSINQGIRQSAAKEKGLADMLSAGMSFGFGGNKK